MRASECLGLGRKWFLFLQLFSFCGNTAGGAATSCTGPAPGISWEK